MQSQYFFADSVDYASQDADQMTGKTDVREFFSIKMAASHAQSTFTMKPRDQGACVGYLIMSKPFG
jgi:hypothetical protein